MLSNEKMSGRIEVSRLQTELHARDKKVIVLILTNQDSTTIEANLRVLSHQDNILMTRTLENREVKSELVWRIFFFILENRSCGCRI